MVLSVLEGLSPVEMVREARRNVPLEPLGIKDSSMRRSITGNLIVEIPGEDREKKAAELAQKFSAVLQDKGVAVSRPMKCAEMRLCGLDETMTREEVVPPLGGCSATDIRVGEIRMLRSGSGTAWVRCPMSAAKAVIRAGRIRVGWSSATVELLKVCPNKCYHCLAYGHVRQGCTAEVDRADLCYRYDGWSHTAARCSAQMSALSRSRKPGWASI